MRAHAPAPPGPDTPSPDPATFPSPHVSPAASGPGPEPAPPARTGRGKRSQGAAAGGLTTAALAICLSLEFLSGILQSWLTPLLPALGEAFGVSHGNLNWISSAYLLSGAVCVPLMAKLGDMFGHLAWLKIAAVSVLAGTTLVAFAPSFELLLVGRVLQGPLSAFLPLLFALARDRAPERAGAIIGMLVGALTIGVSVGTLVSGGLYQGTSSLPLTLALPVLAVAVTLVGLWTGIPESQARARGRIDWWGASTLSVGLVLLLLALGNGGSWGWASLLTLTCLALAAVFLAAWVRVALVVPEPLIDVRAATDRRVLPLYLIGLLLGAQLFGSQTVIALLAGSDPAGHGVGMNLSALAIGGVMTVSGVGAFLASTLANKACKKFGERPTLLAGAAFAAVGFLVMALDLASLPFFLTGVLLTGIGNGCAMAAIPAMIVARVEPTMTGISSGVYNTLRTASGAAAGAVFATVFAVFATADGRPGGAAYTWILGICVACCAGMALLVATIRATPTAPSP